MKVLPSYNICRCFLRQAGQGQNSLSDIKILINFFKSIGMSIVQLKEPGLEGLSSQRLAAVEQKYLTFKDQVVSQEKELSSSQTQKLKQFITQANQIKTKVQAIRAECQQQNAKLNEEINSRQKKLEGFQSGVKNYELEMSFKAKIAEEEKKYISNCQKRIQIAESINYEKLKTIQIDERKSIANEIFKWMIVAIYVEPQNKYYWPNFKDQVIQVKEALFDLKERLAKVSAFHAKEEQKVKTAKFLQIYNQVKKAPQLEKCVSEIQKIYQIAQIFNQCCEISKRVKGYEKQVEENRKLNSKEDDSLVQLRKECDALIEKYKLGQVYLRQLTKVEKSITLKLSKYSEEAAQAEAYTAEMEGMTNSKLVRPLEPEKRDQCECRVY